MDNLSMFDELRKFVPLDEVYKDGELIEYLTRCPFCGDSEKSDEHMHFYIEADTEEHACMCQRCDFKASFLNMYVLRELINHKFSPVLHHAVSVIEQRIKLSFSDSDKIINNNIIKKHRGFVISTESTNNNLQTCNYLSSRFGIEFTPNDLPKYNIIGDLGKFIDDNGIISRFSGIDDWLFNALKKNALGFISNDNTHINFRWIIKPTSSSRRFFIHELIKSSNSSKLYTIKTKIDLLKQVELVIAEGPSTIIGVYNHVYNKCDENRIFAAGAGKYYKHTIMRFIKSLGIIDPKVRLYLDTDTQITGKKSVVKFKDFGIFKTMDIKMFMNDYPGEKDFGITKDKIIINEL